MADALSSNSMGLSNGAPLSPKPVSNPIGLLSPSPVSNPIGLLFPKEVIDVLNTDFLGFKMWHLLLLALVIPSPVIFVLLFLIIPGFKEKVTEIIRNGVPRVYSVFSAGP
jgi:hypothetical protein